MNALVAAEVLVDHCVARDDDSIHTRIRLLLCVANQEFDESGKEPTLVRKNSTIVLSLSPKSAMSLAAQLVDWADSANDVASRITVKKKDE